MSDSIAGSDGCFLRLPLLPAKSGCSSSTYRHVPRFSADLRGYSTFEFHAGRTIPAQREFRFRFVQGGQTYRPAECQIRRWRLLPFSCWMASRFEADTLEPETPFFSDLFYYPPSLFLCKLSAINFLHWNIIVVYLPFCRYSISRCNAQGIRFKMHLLSQNRHHPATSGLLPKFQ